MNWILKQTPAAVSAFAAGFGIYGGQAKMRVIVIIADPALASPAAEAVKAPGMPRNGIGRERARSHHLDRGENICGSSQGFVP